MDEKPDLQGETEVKVDKKRVQSRAKDHRVLDDISDIPLGPGQVLTASSRPGRVEVPRCSGISVRWPVLPIRR